MAKLNDNTVFSVVLSVIFGTLKFYSDLDMAELCYVRDTFKSSIVNYGYQDNYKPVYLLFFFFGGKDFVCTKTRHKQNSGSKTKIS